MRINTSRLSSPYSYAIILILAALGTALKFRSGMAAIAIIPRNTSLFYHGVLLTMPITVIWFRYADNGDNGTLVAKRHVVTEI